MNNEIKEMTKVLKSLGNKQASELYDYITNLQQENEKLLSENIAIKSVRNMVDETIYKSRIDKAINKIQYIKDLGFDYDGFNNVEDLKKLIDELVRIAKQSIDILRGEDK